MVNKKIKNSGKKKSLKILRKKPKQNTNTRSVSEKKKLPKEFYELASTWDEDLCE